MIKKEKRYFVVLFVILFVASIIVHTIINNTDAHYDDSIYWWLGKALGWNVKNIEWGFRGWLLPYIFSMCYQFGLLFQSEFVGYRIFASLMFAFAFTFLFSYIAKILDFKASNRRIALAGGVCGVVFFIFFRGLFIYTLSDFYAFTLSLLSVVFLHSLIEREQRLYIKSIEAFCLGLCLYGTYNIRTIYLFSLIACFCVMIIWQLFGKKWLETIVTGGCCGIGMFLCAIPQMIVNHNLSGNYSWKVPTEGLMLYQLQWGVTAERYATFIGDPAQYSTAGMFFVDNVGQAILNKEQITEFASYGQLIRVMLKYPLDFIGIYVRHFLNMLYPIYPEQYIQDLTKDKSVLLILFYTILFIAVSNFILLFQLKSKRWVWICLILLPCLCILPGAVEIRFFIALHFLIYMYAILGLKEFWIQFKMHKAGYIICYVTGFLLYIAYAGAMLGTTANGIAIINS